MALSIQQLQAEQAKPAKNRALILFLASILAAVLMGLSWSLPWHWIGPLLSVLLIPLVLAQASSWQRYAVALDYYLAGAHGIPLASAVFFGQGRTAEGVALWLASSALLAVGWAFANKPWKVIAVLLFDALVPPLAFFDWLSPLSAAGIFLPGFSWVGLIIFLGIIAVYKFINRYPDIWLGIAMISLIVNIAYTPAEIPQDWKGVNIHIGPSHKSIFKNYTRMKDFVGIADSETKNNHVLLLPETILTWWSGNALYVQQHVPEKALWLVGASVPLSHGYFADGIEAVTRHGAKMIFSSALPVPVSMWMPWRSPNEGRKNLGLLNAGAWRVPQQYKASWIVPARTIKGTRVWASICYDQLLPFVWLEAVFQNPQVILLTNNEWWAHGTGIPQIQLASSVVWSRLIGASALHAENY